MTGLLIGFARVFTNDQDLTAQKNALATVGVTLTKTFTDQGLTGANRARPEPKRSAPPTRRRGSRDRF